jgi:GTPase
VVILKLKILHSNQIKIEKAILIGVQIHGQPFTLNEYLDELEQLAKSSGAITLKRFTQNLDHPHPKTYVGKGKIEEIAEFCKANEIDVALFDDELSPAQIRNIENALPGTKVLSRTHLILDIFAKNARTSQAKTQVELAQSIFMLPRLTGLWTHLSKQKGGIGMKGPGETEIETDRRALRNRISLLSEKLKHIEKIGFTQRSSRQGAYRAALVGYTNVGKSTVMNLLSSSDVWVENKLFATLDATVRKVALPHPDEMKPPVMVLLSDTVGFIRKLPTLLVESFKSTLSEAIEADLLIHVVDISNPKYEDQMMAVKQILHAIGCAHKPEIIVFNKIDAFKDDDTFFVGETGMNLMQFEQSWIAKENAPAVFISAANKVNTDSLRKIIVNEMLKLKVQR